VAMFAEKLCRRFILPRKMKAAAAAAATGR